MERLVGWAYAMRGMQRFKILVEGRQGRKISRTLGVFFSCQPSGQTAFGKIGGVLTGELHSYS